MGATAESRLAKRRINELEEKLERLQRELQQLKAQNRRIGGLRKQAKYNRKREDDLRELLECEEALAFHTRDNNIQSANAQSHKERCRTENCLSTNVTLVPAGCRTVVLCNECSSRYSVIKTDQTNA